MTNLPKFLPSDFRRELYRAPVTEAPEIAQLFTKPGTGLLYEQRVTAYLRGLSQPVARVLDDYRKIWLKEGYIKPEEMPGKLLPKYAPDLPATAIDILQEQIKARADNTEPLTGYKRKQHAPLGLGSLHLYAMLTGRPATLFLGDVNGMGAANEHHLKMIARRFSIKLADASERYAHQLTDSFIYAAAQTTLQTMATESRNMGYEAVWERYRYGGDELALGAADLPVEVGRKLNREKVAPALETLSARAGKNKHEHSKDRDNLFRAGSAIAYAVMALDGNTRPGQISIDADHQIDRQKRFNGMMRRGRLDVQTISSLRPSEVFSLATESGYVNAAPKQRLTKAFRQTLTSRFLQDGVITQDQPLHDNDLMNLLRLELASHLAGKSLTAYEHNKSVSQQAGTDYPRAPNAVNLTDSERASAPYDHIEPEAAKRYIENFTRVMDEEIALLRKERPRSSLVPIPDHEAPLFITPLEHEARQLQLRLKSEGIHLNKEHYGLLNNVLGSFSPLDPSTGVLMGDVMPAIFGRFTNDTERLTTLLSNDFDPAARELLQQLDVGSSRIATHALGISLGNLGGVNALLGHHNSDILLRHFADEIVIGSFKEMGVRSVNFELAHEGGGNLFAAIRPIIESPNGLVSMNTEMLASVEEEMALRTRELGDMKVAAFLRQHGGTVPDGLSENLTFNQIPDPKRRNQPGIDVTTVQMTLKSSDNKGRALSGGQNYEILQEKTEEAVRIKRQRRELASAALASKSARRLRKNKATPL